MKREARLTAVLGPCATANTGGGSLEGADGRWSEKTVLTKGRIGWVLKKHPFNRQSRRRAIRQQSGSFMEGSASAAV